MMDEEVANEKADDDFEKKREEMRKKDEEKTEKNRRRREKKKNKGKGGNAEAENDNSEGNVDGKANVARVTLPGPKQGEDSGDELPATTTEDVGVIIHDDD